MKHKVKAKTYGQYNGRVYEPGDIFTFEDKKLVVRCKEDGSPVYNSQGKPIVDQKEIKMGSWMEPV